MRARMRVAAFFFDPLLRRRLNERTLQVPKSLKNLTSFACKIDLHTYIHTKVDPLCSFEGIAFIAG